jgi:hypothetical protein
VRLDTLQTELKKIEQRRQKLQDRIKKEATAVFTSLPQKVGLKSVDSLINALLPYASPALRQRLGGIAPARARAAPPAAAAKAPAKKATAKKTRTKAAPGEEGG